MLIVEEIEELILGDVEVVLIQLYYKYYIKMLCDVRKFIVSNVDDIIFMSLF